jgi:hypothetical protein
MNRDRHFSVRKNNCDQDRRNEPKQSFIHSFVLFFIRSSSSNTASLPHFLMQQPSGSVIQPLTEDSINPPHTDTSMIQQDLNPDNNLCEPSPLAPGLSHLLYNYERYSLSDNDSEHEYLDKLSQLLIVMNEVEGTCYTSIALYLHKKYLPQLESLNANVDPSKFRNAPFSKGELDERRQFFLNTIKNTPQLHLLLWPNINKPPAEKKQIVNQLPALAWFVCSIYDMDIREDHPLKEELLEIRSFVLSEWHNFTIKPILYFAQAFIKLEAEKRDPYFILFVIQQISSYMDAETNTLYSPIRKPYSIIPSKTGGREITSLWTLYKLELTRNIQSSSSNHSSEISVQAGPTQSLRPADSVSSEVPPSAVEAAAAVDINNNSGSVRNSRVAKPQKRRRCASYSSRRSLHSRKKVSRSQSSEESNKRQSIDDTCPNCRMAVPNDVHVENREYEFEHFLGFGFTPAPIRRLRFRVKWPDTEERQYPPDESLPINWVDLDEPRYTPIFQLITDLWYHIHQLDPHYIHPLVKENCPRL